MDFGQRVKKLRDAAGLTQEELADVLEVSRPAVGAWESGRSRPRLDKMQQLANYFSVTVAELMGESASSLMVPKPSDSITLPVMVAGHAGEFTEEFDPDEIVEIPRKVYEKINDPDAFIIKIRGDCMNRRFTSGTNAIASPRCTPQNGDAVVAEYNGELIVRVFLRGASTLILSPDSYDDRYEDIVFSDPDIETVTLQGVIKWHQAGKVKRY